MRRSLFVGALFGAAFLLFYVQWLYWPLYLILVGGSGFVVVRL
jgi:hypothetical protein